MDLLLDGYWPWWLSGLFFAALVITMWVIERRSLGVSGSYTRVTLQESDADKRFLEKAAESPDLIEDAMLRATLEAFGEEAVESFLAEMAADESAKVEGDEALDATPLPKRAHLAFLVMLPVGAAIATLLSGDWEVQTSLGPLHDAFFGGGWTSVLALLVGGVAVGFGTRMAGGCTSGHGLSGCSRFQVASLVATASFFGTAVAVSFLLRGLL